MSGGYFNYQQYKITEIADQIQEAIDNNDSDELDRYGDSRGRGYSFAIIARFREAVKALRLAQVYAQRCDWLLSDDDGEDSFIRRLESDLRGLEE